ncbi:uncharacterized protein BDV17DRAFT_263580 [Aspergillus undulatus]|uniref:uncharacterized protein n=1 Tax=Aspergillus undulatus TaxID=1810928 RepID=UPI003CCE3B88
METEFYSSLSWALTMDPAESLSPGPWETPSQLRQQGNETWADPQLDLDLLLSASSYPIPEPQPLSPLPQNEGEPEKDSSDASLLYGGVVVSQNSAETRSDPTSGVPSTPNALKHRISKPGEPVRKRGRPRKLIEDGADNPEERRRTQVRMAQRAYRSRKEANISQLKDRIYQLETAVKQMSTSVISFGDDLVRSGALDSHPELLKPLGNTVQACLALPALPQSESEYQMEEASTSSSKSSQRKRLTSANRFPSTPQSPTMDIPEFIDRLHITCSYQAYLVCANPSIPQRHLERPFRILLSLMPRAFVAEFFKDWLLAKAGHKTLEHWAHIPFFRIGGAGTHYPTTGNVYHPFRTHRSKPLVEEDVSRFAFTDEMGEELEDVWYDMGDLQGYLREREIRFPASAPAMSSLGVCQKEQGANSVARLMQRLVRGAICLGRSPGFRRRDVETAVGEFVASHNFPAS